MLGVDGVFVGSGIFKAERPAQVARAIVQASAHPEDSGRLAQVSMGLGEPMRGLDIATMPSADLLQNREARPATPRSTAAPPA